MPWTSFLRSRRERLGCSTLELGTYLHERWGVMPQSAARHIEIVERNARIEKAHTRYYPQDRSRSVLEVYQQRIPDYLCALWIPPGVQEEITALIRRDQPLYTPAESDVAPFLPQPTPARIQRQLDVLREAAPEEFERIASVIDAMYRLL